MKGPPIPSGSILRAQSQGPNQKRKLPTKTKYTRFDTLVGRYYPAVYSFASRLTDDPREATFLTREAFDRLRKQLRTCRDESVLASILMSILIGAGLGTA
jgi:hypothetical protein